MEVPEEITNALKEIYAKKGRDFTFKCRLLAKILKYPGQKISRNLPKLEKKGIIIRIAQARTAIIYRTCFDGGADNTGNL